MAALVGAGADFTAEMAVASELPFPATIPVGEQAAIAAHWVDLFGGWE